MKLNAIELEIIRSRLDEAVLTMQNQLFHSGYSPILRESSDGSACILDRNGCCVVAGMPLHMFPFYHSVQGLIASAADRMRSGDSFLINDPYSGGALHVPDTAIVTPFFHNGELAAFCASMAHKPDIGGLVIGSSSAAAREIYHDGLIFPGVRFWSAEGANPDFIAMLRSNTRSPVEAIGDLRAQVGCTHIGYERLKELFDHYSGETMAEAFEALIAASANRIKQKLVLLLDGEGEAEALLDHDGADLSKSIKISVKLVKKGETIIVDFSGSDPHTIGPVNLRPQAAEAGAALALVGMLDPDIPFNDGCRRAIEFINPSGRITNAEKPRPVNSYFATTHLLYCVTQKAFSQIAPERAVAPSGLGIGAFAIGYQSTRNGTPGALYELSAASLGGTSEGDGSFLVYPVVQISPTQPIEILESEYPVEVTRFARIIDSAGAGRHRGGSGYLREYRLLEDAMVTVRLGQFEHGAWGVAGGRAPNRAACILNMGTEKEECLPTLFSRPLKAGDTISFFAAGGGGYGPPELRLPERVAEDACNGIVSIELARKVYRVAIDGQGEVNEKETRELRAHQAV